MPTRNSDVSRPSPDGRPQPLTGIGTVLRDGTVVVERCDCLFSQLFVREFVDAAIDMIHLSDVTLTTAPMYDQFPYSAAYGDKNVSGTPRLCSHI
jgi:hypothetical protein